MRVLILDDDERRVQAFVERLSRTRGSATWARSAWQAILSLETKGWDVVFLDHDLGLTPEVDPGTGMHVVDFIVQNAPKFHDTHFVVHSMNEPAAARMVRALHHCRLRVTRAPLAWETLRVA